MDFGADTPAAYDSVPIIERDARCELTADFCVIDQSEFFVRGCIEIPVIDGPRPFVWGVWASLSQQSYQRIKEIWELAERESDHHFSDGFARSCRSIQTRFC